MKELGEHGPAYHAALAEPLAASRADFAILVGDEMRALADELGKGRGIRAWQGPALRALR